MNKHPDWQADSGEPPTAEEMLAYSRGRLPADEARRVWERLQQFPDLAEVYTAPFPEDGGGMVSDAEIDRRWEAFRKTIPHDDERDGGRVVQFPRLLPAVAAGIIAVLAGLLVYSQIQLRNLRDEHVRPRVAAEYRLATDMTYRGGGVSSPRVRASSVAKLVVTVDGSYYDYKAAIREHDSKRVIWSGSGLDLINDNEIEIFVPPGVLRAGTNYQVVVYGSDGKQLDTFTFTVIP